MLKSELEKLKQEKESNQLKIENFDNASKSLEKLIGSQIPNKGIKGLGFVSYNAVPPPPTRLFLPPNLDLSNSGLEEFQQHEFEGNRPKTSKNVSKDTYNEVRESPDALMVKKLVSGDKLEKKTIFPTVVKIEFVRSKQQEKPVRKLVKYAEMYRPKAVNTARSNSVVVNTVRENQGHPQKEGQGYVDSGCSRHMTWNMSYLSDFMEFDGGYVTFRGAAKGGKITGKGTLKTGKIDFEDVYFLADESQVLLKVSRKNNMYSVNMKNIVPKESLTCVVAKATINESMLWHRRLGHVNFKTINKLVKDNLVRGLSSKCFENHQTCVACLKGKQHKASCRFTWVFFLASKDETSGILKSFITEIENLVDKKVKIIRCDSRTEFKNRVMSEFYEKKDIKKEFSLGRTPQQNGVAERRNRTLIKAARTMLADSKLPTTFWAEAVNTAFYVQNMVLVAKPHNKTPYELFRGRTPALSFMRTFGRHVTIINTLDYLGKFDGKSKEGFFVRYSLNSKAFRVYNIRTRKVEESLHIRFLEDKPIIAGDGPKWLFDIDVLTKSMNYVPVVARTNSNDLVDGLLFDYSSKNDSKDEPQPSSDAGKKDDEGVNKESGIDDQERPKNSTQDVNIVGPSINTASTNVNTGSLSINTISPIVTIDPLKATHTDFFGDQAEVGMSNITTTCLVPSTLNTRIHKDHSLDHIIGDVQSGVQTRRMTKTINKQGFISVVCKGKTYEDLHTCLFACFISQEEPKKVWTLVDLPHGKRAIGTKWVYKNKKDERGIVIRNKARLVAQGYTQEEGIDYDEVFALVARIEAIRLFLAYASFKDFVVYQMDVKSAFLYGKIEEEVYVCQPPGFEDPEFPDRVYKVEKALYGLHQAPRAWYETLSTYLLDNGFQRGQIDKTLFIKRVKGDILLVQMSSMGELTFFLGLQVTQKDDGIFISQDKYVDEILKKFGFSTVKTASTPMETSKPLLKDAEAEDVDVHLYRSMIGSLMYLTASRPDIMFVVCACARFQVTPKVSHLHVVKRIFRYLKDRKSKIGGCQFLGSRLISWQCKKQTIVANSTTEAVHVLYASCYGQIGYEVPSIVLLLHNVADEDCFQGVDDRVVALETDLTQTKKVYGAAFTKLIKKVKRLEKKDKLNKSRRKPRLVLSDKEGSDSDILAPEDPSKQRRKIAQIDEDEGITLKLVLPALKLKLMVISVDVIAAEGKLLHYSSLRGYSFDEIKSLFEATMKRVNTFTPMESDVDRTVPKIAAGSTKRAAEEELGQQSSKKQKSDELSQEELQQLMIIVPEEGMIIIAC
ncbi:putative ribonuclease H-like domain-containing protein [Tanacetum coccineum]